MLHKDPEPQLLPQQKDTCLQESVMAQTEPPLVFVVIIVGAKKVISGVFAIEQQVKRSDWMDGSTYIRLSYRKLQFLISNCEATLLLLCL